LFCRYNSLISTRFYADIGMGTFGVKNIFRMRSYGALIFSTVRKYGACGVHKIIFIYAEVWCVQISNRLWWLWCNFWREKNLWLVFCNFLVTLLFTENNVSPSFIYNFLQTILNVIYFIFILSVDCDWY